MTKPDSALRTQIKRWVAITLGLAALTVLAYLPVFQADFVNYDDQAYVTENPQVQAGLTWAGVKWAFTTDLMGSWHPITWLSHMLDVQCFGTNPVGPHVVNLGLHVANVLLLLALLQQLTGALWPGVIAAALFALHPLHVESVAWVSERKDVLCAFFGLLSLLAYARYARSSILHPPASNFGFFRSPAYWLTGLLLLLGLLSKPMLVTWPLLMLLLDCWPLGRLQPSTWKWLLAEKAVFFLIIGVVAVVTVFTQHGSEAVISLQELPLPNRLANVLNSVFVYVLQFFWPTNLVPFYPFVMEISAARLWLAGAVLAAITLLAVCFYKPKPYLGVGWFWYLISLLPVCGLVQVGLQAHADRYTYLPSIGLGAMVAWGVAEVIRVQPRCRDFIVALMLTGLGLLGWRTHVQAQLWQNTEALFTHALAVTEGNFIAHQSLGEEKLKQGKIAEARNHFETALAINPRMPIVRNNIAVMLLRDGKFAEAATEFADVLSRLPDYHTARYNHAQALEGLGQFENAVAVYREYLARQPHDVEAWLAVVRCLARLGRNSEAVQQLQAARQSFPTEVRIYAALAVHWVNTGNLPEAIAEYERGLTAVPDSPELGNNLAWLLATHPDQRLRNGARAVQLAEHVCQLTAHQQPFLLGTLAAAYAEAGRFADAVTTAQRAVELARAAGQTDLAARNTELLELYRARKPYHEPAPEPQASPR